MAIVSAVIITLATVSVLINMNLKLDPERMALHRMREDEQSIMRTFASLVCAWIIICLVPFLVMMGF